MRHTSLHLRLSGPAWQPNAPGRSPGAFLFGCPCKRGPALLLRQIAGAYPKFCPAVAGPGRLVLGRIQRLLLTIADGSQPVRCDPLIDQKAHRCCTAAIAEGQIVLVRPPLVSMSLNSETQLGMGPENLRLGR